MRSVLCSGMELKKTCRAAKKNPKLEKNLFGMEKNTSGWKKTAVHLEKTNRFGRNMTVGKKTLREKKKQRGLRSGEKNALS